MPDPGPLPDPPVEPTTTSVGVAAFPHIPGYAFRKRLGKGGMATVYLATQQSLDRPVAIKVVEREALRDEVSKQRFENEARTIARLTHPGIVGIHEVGRTDEGQMFYVMPYLANGDLSRHDLRGDETRIAEVLRALLSALGHAHARGIVHRDVKRENVLFDVADRPLLTDFCIATSKTGDARLTSAGMALGSSAYMAPEQARGAVVDGRADLYSVGVLAYELLTGQLPFYAEDGLALAIMHAQDPVPRLPPARQHWQAFIDKALAKAPEERFANAQQMQEALDATGTGRRPVAAAVDPRRARLLLAGAAVLLLAVLAFALRSWMADDAPAPDTVATPSSAPPADPPADEPAPSTPAEPAEPADAPADTTPPAADKPPTTTKPAPPPKRQTIGSRARKASNKVKSWFRRH